MRYEVEIGGRTRVVDVQRMDPGFVVSMDGQESRVDVERVDAHTLSVLIGTSSHELLLATDPVSGQIRVAIGAVSIPAALNGRRRWGRKDAGSGASGPERVVAPMPGKVVRVLAKPGDGVQPRQAVVVIEAMKMENELRASRAGVVSELTVQEGQSVEAGALLMVIAPV
jgi:biotin carboxyl carrier protein